MPKPTSLFVDTSGWACYIDRADPLHQQMVTLFQRAATPGQELVTTNYVIAELVALLTTRLHLSRPHVITIIDLIKAMPNLEILHITPSLDDEAWQLLKARRDKEWSQVDAASFVVMTTHGMTEAATTDHHFLQAGFVRLPH